MKIFFKYPSKAMRNIRVFDSGRETRPFLELEGIETGEQVNIGFGQGFMKECRQMHYEKSN